MFNKKNLTAIILLLSTLQSLYCFTINKNLEEQIIEFQSKGDIPGFSLIIVDNEKTIIKNYGTPDLVTNEELSSSTLFEIGSTTKAFTALAILQMEKDSLLSLDEPVTNYIPWLKMKYNGVNQKVTIKQALHHTTGLDWATISDIPVDISQNALENTVKVLIDKDLKHLPGTIYEYATINYDILGLIIEKISGISYEQYIEEKILKPLDMNNSSLGYPKDKAKMSKGYKIGFFSPREYNAPVYKGNWPAGYLITNADDYAKWLRFQLNINTNAELSQLLSKSHLRDETVAPSGYSLSSYAAGWNVSLKGDGVITHGGSNPNFTSYIAFIPNKKVGVAVLSNSNSEYTGIIGDYVLQHLSGVAKPKPQIATNKDDTTYSLLSIMFALVIVSIIVFIVSIFVGVMKKKRQYEPLNGKKIFLLALFGLSALPLVYGIYLLPKAMAGFSWSSTIVWLPVSFASFISLFLLTIAVSYLAFFISLIFPSKNKYLKSLPLIIVLSLLSGLANSAVIFLIINSVASNIKLIYLVYYFILAFIIYIAGRKIIETKLLHLTYMTISDIRINLIEKIFSTSYQKFEKIDRGKVYATLNNDTAVLGGSAGLVVSLITNGITVVCVFVYLGSISFLATLLTLVIVGSIATLYYFVSKTSEVYFNEARETQNTYMDLLSGMLNGFKELCINRFKKIEYKKDIENTVDLFTSTTSTASIKFINSFLIGESLLVIILGFVSFAFPKIFPDVQSYILMSFLMVLLYLIGPINGILHSIPGILQLKISWERIQSFVKSIPSTHNLLDDSKLSFDSRCVNSLKLEAVEYEYQNQDEHDRFKVGPINLEINKGEILFIVGGNGSGKTTLANIITGLYNPDKGVIKIDDKEIGNADLGEHFSAVFSDNNLFGKLYTIDTVKNEDLIKEYIAKFYLEDKVKLADSAFSTTQLSSGQRKRLALIKCFLENSPIYMFDEVAADQDPDFKRYFYRELLQQMKKEGKIIIAITHDDHYFDVADKVLKMDGGKMEYLKDNKIESNS